MKDNADRRARHLARIKERAGEVHKADRLAREEAHRLRRQQVREARRARGVQELQADR